MSPDRGQEELCVTDRVLLLAVGVLSIHPVSSLTPFDRGIVRTPF